jgi:phage terminase large subunit
MLYRTSTYYKIRRIKSKIKVIQGGQGAGKNIAIAQILLEDCAIDKDITTIVTDTYDNLKDGVISDMKMLYDEMGLNWESDYNKTEHDLKHCGGIIQFRYVSDIKKQAGKSKRRGKLYINEANKIGWEVASTYIGRTHGDVYLDYNPDFEFWAHTQLPKLKNKNGNQLSEQIIVTYLDNEMLPQSEIDYIESRRDNEDWFRVYGLGQTGYYSERRIYNYKLIDNVPDIAMKIPSGIDFGVSPDPTILIDLWNDNNKLFIDEVFCENNLMPEKIKGAERLAIVDKFEIVKHNKGQLTVADSAGRTEINDLLKYGYNILGVKKYPGSQIDGIKKVKGYDLYITKRSINIKKGIEDWFFKVDKNGLIIPEPDGHEPDGLAALRYAVMEWTSNKNLISPDKINKMFNDNN